MKYTSIFRLTLLAAVPALALPTFISFVSQTSCSDSNLACTTSTPCQTLQGAYAKTIPGGIVKVMDAGAYSPIVITQPITLDGNGVATIIVDGVNTQGVNVQAGVGPAEIRNLTINVVSCSACYGIQTQNGSASIENVSITGAPSIGVQVNGGTAAIHGLTVTNATLAGIYFQGSTATISDSIVRYSPNYGIFLVGNNAVGATQVLIERSKIISNGVGLLVSNAGAAATARISDCVITGNTTGVQTSGGGQIITFRNNTWAGNTTDGATPFSISLK